ncbi:MAG: hypothetical protein R2862_04040 [Thermoanaerobaculia bacterium]
MRLDWILISEGLDFTNYQTLDDHVSDHLGILADVRLRGESARSGRSGTDEAESDQPPRRLPSVSLA